MKTIIKHCYDDRADILRKNSLVSIHNHPRRRFQRRYRLGGHDNCEVSIRAIVRTAALKYIRIRFI